MLRAKAIMGDFLVLFGDDAEHMAPIDAILGCDGETERRAAFTPAIPDDAEIDPSAWVEIERLRAR